MNSINAATPQLGHWSTDEVAPLDATDAWQAALSSNYGHWQVTKAVTSGFSASIRNRTFSGLRVVECVCDPCTGRRIPQSTASIWTYSSLVFGFMSSPISAWLDSQSGESPARRQHLHQLDGTTPRTKDRSRASAGIAACAVQLD